MSAIDLNHYMARFPFSVQRFYYKGLYFQCNSQWRMAMMSVKTQSGRTHLGRQFLNDQVYHPDWIIIKEVMVSRPVFITLSDFHLESNAYAIYSEAFGCAKPRYHSFLLSLDWSLRILLVGCVRPLRSILH